MFPSTRFSPATCLSQENMWVLSKMKELGACVGSRAPKSALLRLTETGLMADAMTSSDTPVLSTLIATHQQTRR